MVTVVFRHRLGRFIQATRSQEPRSLWQRLDVEQEQEVKEDKASSAALKMCRQKNQQPQKYLHAPSTQQGSTQRCRLSR